MFEVQLSEYAAMTLLELVQANVEAARLEVISCEGDILGQMIAQDRLDALLEAQQCLAPVAALFEE